ncbi:MAG: hypothetical protein AB1665_03300 [Candidatus Thermoplasmatota archaeon]
MDSEGFVRAVEERLVPIAPIIGYAIKKQLHDIGADRRSLTPELSLLFIDRMVSALDLFLGQKGAKEAKHLMLKELRRFAPEYFEKLEGLG